MKLRRALSVLVVATAVATITVLGGAVAPARAAGPTTHAIPTNVTPTGALALGTRLTWQAGDSATQGTTLVPDPNGWIWRDDQWWSPRSSGGTGGAGFIELTVVSSDATAIVGDVRQYVNDLQFNSPVVSGYGVAVSDSTGGLPGFWLPPTQLAAMPVGFDGVTRTTNGQRTINGQTFDVVSIATTGNGSYSSLVYDATSGVLLFGGTMSAAPGIIVTDQSGNVLDSATGAVTYSHQLFAGSRQVSVPWATQATPSWVHAGLATAYDVYTVADVAGGSPLANLNGRTTHVLDQAVGAAFIGRQLDEGFKSTGVNTSSTGQRVYATATFDGLWIPPAAFAELSPQQVLDQDPITSRTVTFAGTQANGLVAVVTTGAIDQLEQYYDPNTGLLTLTRYMVNRGSIGTATTEFRLSGQQ